MAVPAALARSASFLIPPRGVSQEWRQYRYSINNDLDQQAGRRETASADLPLYQPPLL